MFLFNGRTHWHRYPFMLFLFSLALLSNDIVVTAASKPSVTIQPQHLVRPQWITGPRLLKLGESIDFHFFLPEGASIGTLDIFPDYLRKAKPDLKVITSEDLSWLSQLEAEDLTLDVAEGRATVTYEPAIPGNYLARWQVGEETLYRYFAVVEDDWTVVRFTGGGDWRPNFHGIGIPLEYRLEIEKVTEDSPVLKWHIDYQRRFGDAVVPLFPDTPELSIEERTRVYGEGLEEVRRLLPDPGDARAVQVAMLHPMDPGYVPSLQKLDIVDQGGMWESNGRPWLGMPEFPFFVSPNDMRKPNQAPGGPFVAHQWDFCGGFHFLGPNSWHYVVSEGDWAKTDRCLRTALDEARNLAEMSGHPAFFLPLFGGTQSQVVDYPEPKYGEAWDTEGMRQYLVRYLYAFAFEYPKEYKLACARSIDIAYYYRRHFPVTPRTVFVSQTDHLDYDFWWLAGYAGDRVLRTKERIPWGTRVPTMEYLRNLRKYVYKDPNSCEYILIEDQRRQIRFERESPNPIWWFDYTRQEEEIGAGGSTITWVAMPEVKIRRTRWMENKEGIDITLTMETDKTFDDYAIALWGLPSEYSTNPDPGRIRSSADSHQVVKNTKDEYHLLLFFNLKPGKDVRIEILPANAKEEP